MTSTRDAVAARSPLAVRARASMAELRPGRRLARLLGTRAAYGPVGLVVLVAVQFLLAYAAVALAPPDHGVAAWWPAAGVAVGVLVLAPRDRWVRIVLAITVGTTLANLSGGRTVPVAVGFGLSNALEAWVVTWWLLRGRPRATLVTLEDFARLVSATLVGGVVMGLGAGLTVALGTDGSFVTAARTVMTSHGAAILLIAPLFLGARTTRGQGRAAEATAQWLVTLAVVAIVFHPAQRLPLTFALIPFLVWGALRLGTRTVAAQMVLVAVVITAVTRGGGGPFGSRADVGPSLAVTLTQAFLVTCLLVLLPLALTVSQRRADLERVGASERLFRQGFSEALLGMLLLRRTTRWDGTPDLEVVELNAVAARILLSSAGDLIGSSWTSCLHEVDRAAVGHALRAVSRGELQGWHGEVALGTGDGSRWVEIALSPLSTEAGDGMYVAQMVDVTARRAAEDRLTAQALQDSLTGLANRTLLRDRIDLGLRTLARDEGVAVLFCDLDDFKRVNDSTGHAGGDALLVEVADRLRGMLRPDDVAARVGGDEFVLLRPHARGPAEAEELAGAVLDALGVPFAVGGQTFTLGASIGIAWGTAGATPDDLLRDADSAMYAAKTEGKRRAVVFSDKHRARVLRAVRVEAELREAVDRDELLVYLQPVVDLRDGRTVAAEALLRWRHPERGVLGPHEFLDVAESAGLMPQIGTWVLERSCELAARWPAVGGGLPPAVHVNVSARQLDVPDFVETVRAVVARTGIDPGRLVLEFTETQLDEVSEALLGDLRELRDEGIGLAADDYGTGYSPLTRIIELPISMVKIDRRFVSEMLVDVRSRAIVTTLVRLSQSLDLDLVAEGVETLEQAEALRELGCTLGQGYLWSRPVPSRQFQQGLETARARSGRPAPLG
ncbi:EAL domain-containing protein [Actinotalea sp. K2]|uniref:bifunctional diguanylate cyclase/phosphodiesterase n=1 Tax=Actinotalea sp. K2 TaxID=2939438 RepID=UPI00201810D2|nr:EAL domain-containing protein [Actinotalea sp. K2]MCL3863248.1 EAL domain-containing protein [Actinotalea sp. K2]